MAAFVPQATGDEARRRPVSAAARDEDRDAAAARARRERDLPEHDEQGRPYSAQERARLAQLWFDPRRGFAPEARIAIAAWRAFGLDLGRDRSGACDFRDASGEVWNIIADDDATRRERAIAASPAINLILCNTDGTMALHARSS